METGIVPGDKVFYTKTRNKIVPPFMKEQLVLRQAWVEKAEEARNEERPRELKD